MIFAGFPPIKILSSSNDFVTMLPAATTTWLPNFTSDNIIAPVAIQQFDPIIIGAAFLYLW